MGIQHIADGIFEERGDVDWFRMRLVAGQTYQIKGPANLILNVILPSGEVMSLPFASANSLNFVAPVSGDYFLSVTSLGVTGFYQITVEDVPDPIPATVATPRTLDVGGSVTVSAAENPNTSQNNDDWFAIDVVAGQSYFLATAAFGSTVYVVDANGVLVAAEGFQGWGGRQVHFTATETGRLYAGISLSGGTAYTLTLAAVADDHGDTPGGAGSLTVGGSVGGLWETPGDDDAYAIALTAGLSYRFSVENADISQMGFVQILDAAGDLIWTSLTQTITTFSPDADGTYYVVAGTRESNSNPTGQWAYTLSAAVIANDFTDNILTTGTLAVGGQTAGTFNAPGDRDWVRIELVQGQSYLFTMNAQNWQNSEMALYDAQGELVRSAGTTFFGSQLHHTAEATGTYYVAAVSGTQPGTYTLIAETVEDDFADNSATTGLVVNGVMSGILEVDNDVDWFAVELVAGRTYSLLGPFAVYDAAANPLTMVNWGDASFTPATSGIYYLAVSGAEGEYVYGIAQISDDYLESALTFGVVRHEIIGTGNADTFVSSERYEFFDGAGGNDLFVGGTGYDFFFGSSGIDTLSYADAGGAMEINMLTARGQRSGAQAYDIFAGIENIIGSAFADIITGNGAANVLDGGGGADQLNGSGGNDVLVGGAGNDVMAGGLGNDIYYVADSGDVVNELAGQGNDRVATAASFALALSSEVELIEAITQTSTDAMDLTGSDSANTLNGNDGVNILRGEGGNDIQFGYGGTDYFVGGTGTDVMYGGAGNDTFYIDEPLDVVNEAVGEGTDRIAASVSYVLNDASEVELLEAVNLTATDALDFTGSNLGNVIYGNYGVNILRGEGGSDTLYAVDGNDFLDGGAGADIMVGGKGNDVYYIDHAGDLIGELAGEGYDRIATSVSLALLPGAEIELLEVVNSTATDAIDLSGSDFANVIVGNAGVNILRGFGGDDELYGLDGDDIIAGGSGNDLMVGGAGNDIYYVEEADDAVLELAGGGSDRIATSVSYALGATAEVELLEAVDTGGTGALDLTGSGSANTLGGNNGANLLDGLGGSDLLTGYGGADMFRFSTALGGGNADTIADFVSGTDRIQLDDAIFAALAPGALGSGAFVIGAAALDADDRILYNNATGALLYDADGNGAGTAILFATLQGAPALTANDFLVI